MPQPTADTISAQKAAQAPPIKTEVLKSNPEPKEEPKSVIPEAYVSPAPTPVKKVVRDNRIFMLTNDKRQGNVIIDLEEEVFDPKTNTVRAMRLVRRAPSIWRDEQPASNFTAAYIEKNTLTVMFQKGRVTVPTYEIAILHAMELSNRNVDNKKRVGAKDFYFKEWNPEEENKKAIKEEDDVIAAMGMAIKAPYPEMVQHAAYLNIQFVDEQGIEYDEDALRAAYIRYAKNNAPKFLKSIHSPTVKVAYLVKKAFNAGKIDLGLSEGAAYWQDGGFITTLPEGRDALDYLIEYAQTFGDKNIQFKNQLEQNAV